MKLTVVKDVKVMELFLHDQYDCGNIDADHIAEILTHRIDMELSNSSSWSVYRVIPPDTLDRFTIRYEDASCETHYLTERCYTIADLKRLWPSELFFAMERIAKRE